MATKTTTTKKVVKPTVTLGSVVMLYTKSSSHGVALLDPKIVSIEEAKFIEGTQVTGKSGHRMERKRTLVPFDHVASIVEFAAEDELWSEPQPKHLRVPDEDSQSASLTSHEQPPMREHNRGGHPRHRNNNRSRGRNNRMGGQGGHAKDNDARLQEQYDSRRNREFNR